MEHDYWHNKWETNDIGFHEADGNPYLKKYISFLGESDRGRIFVPLCGKTKDIGYLLAQGFDVVAAELNEMAITQLFDELRLQPEIEALPSHKRYSSSGLTVYVGDIFTLTTQLIGAVSAIYDRAALVALPDPMRQEYAKHIVSITGNAPQLLLTFEYDQDKHAGPPFSVSQSLVTRYYTESYNIELLTQSAVPGGLKGLLPAECLVFGLTAK